jgi:hypothetical protein
LLGSVSSASSAGRPAGRWRWYPRLPVRAHRGDGPPTISRPAVARGTSRADRVVRPRPVHLGIASGDPPQRLVTSRIASMASIEALGDGVATADCRVRCCRDYTTTSASLGAGAPSPRRAQERTRHESRPGSSDDDERGCLGSRDVDEPPPGERRPRRIWHVPHGPRARRGCGQAGRAARPATTNRGSGDP